MKKNLKILIVAGEASGDRHAADLVRDLKIQSSEIRFAGIGGDRMAEAGVELLFHISQMAFLGFSEIFRHLPFILGVFRRLKSWIRSQKPTAVVLVDYPGFNLRLAKIAKKFNLPVIYYICPQLWAWRENRVKIIRRYVDLLLVIFKFEENFYRERGVNPKFVGHPLVDQAKIHMSEREFRKQFELPPEQPIIAILPGSRRNEISKILPVVLNAIDQFEHRAEYCWVIGKAPGIRDDLYDEFLSSKTNVVTVRGGIEHLIEYARVVLVASGTATLETAFLGTPMIVLYKVSALSYAIGKRVVKLKNIALANIVSGKKIVPELIQNDLTPANILNALQRYLGDEKYYRRVKTDLSRIPELLGEPGASRRAASEILHFLDKSVSGPGT